jgi:hypothetical protein
MSCYNSLPEYFTIFKSHLAEKLAINCMSRRVHYHIIPHSLQIHLFMKLIVNFVLRLLWNAIHCQLWRISRPIHSWSLHKVRDSNKNGGFAVTQKFFPSATLLCQQPRTIPPRRKDPRLHSRQVIYRYSFFTQEFHHNNNLIKQQLL